MSVRVNLLPEATKARSRAARQRGIALLCGVLLLVLLGGVWFWGDQRLSNAEDELAREETETARLRGEQAELVAFNDLADRRERANEVLAAALGGEVSVAAILQDLASVTPSDTQFDSLTVQLTPPDPDDPEANGTVGTFNIGGRTLTSHAPGVERVLISLNKISTLDELYLNSSSLDAEDEEIASFSVDGSITSQARTRRYEDGMTEELR
ncbi:MAG: hypothetical protein ACLFRD_11185 [Nitriliruptoraceae bacterium]